MSFWFVASPLCTANFCFPFSAIDRCLSCVSFHFLTGWLVVWLTSCSDGFCRIAVQGMFSAVQIVVFFFIFCFLSQPYLFFSCPSPSSRDLLWSDGFLLCLADCFCFIGAIAFTWVSCNFFLLALIVSSFSSRLIRFRSKNVIRLAYWFS